MVYLDVSGLMSKGSGVAGERVTGGEAFGVDAAGAAELS